MDLSFALSDAEARYHTTEKEAFVVLKGLEEVPSITALSLARYFALPCDSTNSLCGHGYSSSTGTLLAIVPTQSQRYSCKDIPPFWTKHSFPRLPVIKASSLRELQFSRPKRPINKRFKLGKSPDAFAMVINQMLPAGEVGINTYGNFMKGLGEYYRGEQEPGLGQSSTPKTKT